MKEVTHTETKAPVNISLTHRQFAAFEALNLIYYLSNQKYRGLAGTFCVITKIGLLGMNSHW